MLSLTNLSEVETMVQSLCSKKRATVIELTNSADPSKRVSGESRTISVARFGGKAASLARLVDAGVDVPPAYGLAHSVAENIIQRRISKKALRLLEAAFEHLIAESPIKRIIVRSSHVREDGTDFRLSGIFASVPDVRTFEEMIDAIRTVGQSGRNVGESVIPLVLQSQISCSHSAIVLTNGEGAKVEVYRGNLAGPISGAFHPTVVISARNEETGVGRFRVVNDGAQLGSVAVSLATEAIESLRELSKRPALFELGRASRNWKAFQFQPVESTYFPDLSTSSCLGSQWRLSNDDVLGKKAAAMLFFQRHGLFRKNLHVIGPGKDVPSDGSFLGTWSPPYTIRFSKRSLIGLPRIFTSSRKKALEAIKERPKDWTAIIHEFIPVVRSFELLIHSDYLHLEHVPGLWESESGVPPDALVVKGDGTCTAYAARISRQVKTGTAPAGGHSVVEPTSDFHFQEWATRISALAADLRAEIGTAPINLHFVEDSDGEWHFLNVRPGYMPADAGDVAERFYRVVRVGDLASWNGTTPLLLSLRTERGGEGDLAGLAQALRDLKVPIFSEFGLLSHPAMVLQAYGVRLQPSYFIKEEFGSATHRRWSFRLDRGHDPFVRITREAALIESRDLFVVQDREPIVPGHLLVVAKYARRSFADGPDPSESLEQLVARDCVRRTLGASALIYERGRAPFCTSGFTAEHAHYHVLPAERFEPSWVPALLHRTEARRYASPGEAWKEARRISGEYLLFGFVEGPCFLSRFSGSRHEKRFMRRFLERHRRDRLSR